MSVQDQFEAWHRSVVEGEPPHEKYSNGDYVNPHVNRYWKGWQASREAVVVSIPPEPQVPEDPECAIDDSHMDAYHSAVRMRHACMEAIEAQGLRVSP